MSNDTEWTPRTKLMNIGLAIALSATAMAVDSLWGVFPMVYGLYFAYNGGRAEAWWPGGGGKHRHGMNPCTCAKLPAEYCQVHGDSPDLRRVWLDS